MKIILVDDEPYTIIGMMSELEDLFPSAQIDEYRSPLAFLENAVFSPDDAVYLIDYNMSPLTGFDTIKKICDNTGAVELQNVFLYTGNIAYIPDLEKNSLLSLKVTILEKGTGKQDLFAKIEEKFYGAA